KGPLARALVDLMKQRSDGLTRGWRESRGTVLDCLHAVKQPGAEEDGYILGAGHTVFAALAPVVPIHLIGLCQRSCARELVDGRQRGFGVVVCRLDELAVDVGDTSHSVDDRTFDHARRLVGVVMPGRGALLRGGCAPVDEVAVGLRKFEL